VAHIGKPFLQIRKQVFVRHSDVDQTCSSPLPCPPTGSTPRPKRTRACHGEPPAFQNAASAVPRLWSVPGILQLLPSSPADPLRVLALILAWILTLSCSRHLKMHGGSIGDANGNPRSRRTLVAAFVLWGSDSQHFVREQGCALECPSLRLGTRIATGIPQFSMGTGLRKFLKHAE
jgi:hypothetical protein